MVTFHEQYLAALPGIRERRQIACLSCSQLFDPEANIPSGLTRGGQCDSCEGKDINALADRLAEDMPGSHMFANKSL
jgi:hypothetical protein